MPPPRRRPVPDPLLELRHLTTRDRLLLSWLAEHYVLSTPQIAEALFPSLRAAQKRLTLLHRITAVSRFSFARTDTHPDTAMRYTLGPLGVLLHPDAYTDPTNPHARPPRSHLQRRARILHTGHLEHLLAVNGFFTALHAHTRTHPDTALLRWWSEHHTTTAHATAGIRPDAHGIWTANGHTVAFFLEHDNATEALPVALAKLRAYQRLAQHGPRHPVLYRVPDPRREAAIHRALAGVHTAMPVATSTHHTHPAQPVWALTGHTGPRLALHELPTDPRAEFDDLRPFGRR